MPSDTPQSHHCDSGFLDPSSLYLNGNVHVLADRLVPQLARQSATLATCESLTGGQLASSITAVPGASQVFVGGLITYNDHMKVALAGLDPVLLTAYGPYNHATAMAMATGTLRQCDATIACSTTGVAGPGPDGETPVGTVHIAVAIRHPSGSRPAVSSKFVQLSGSREQIQADTVRHSLIMIENVIKNRTLT